MHSGSVIISWAVKLLSEKGYSLLSQSEIVFKTPWSEVIRLVTANGNFYLKQTPASLFLEPETIRILSDKSHIPMPIVVGINPHYHCFLMQDAGKPLCDHLKIDFQWDLLCEGIKQYCQIQLAAILHIDDFLNLGVPDWRLERFPSLFQELILQKDFLLEDGFNQKELSELQELMPLVSNWCNQLSEYGIAETLDHCDLHDGNILINAEGVLTIIDWGETVITHPFFSLHHSLSDMVVQYSLKKSEERYNRLRASCFDKWIERYPTKNVSAAILLAKELRPIYSALAYYRLHSANAEEFKSSQKIHGRVANYLRELL